MLYLKKYFTEGLIQMAILLSLCGVRVDVGLETYLPSSWHERILGPTSALTQTQFHNLRNRLEDGQDLHPKSVDLDEFFTSRRLLGIVRSLDRLQIPNAELETWLVQREPDPLPVVCPDQAINRPAPPVEPRPGISTLQDEEEEEEDREHHILNQRGEDEEDEEEEDSAWLYRRTEEGAARNNNRELSQNEVDQTSVSLQECLRLLQDTFPFTEEQFIDAGARGGDQENQPTARETLRPSPTGNPSVDLELHWQDLLAIMEPETNTDVDMTSSDHNQNQRATGSLQGVGSGAPQINSNHQADPETPLQHGHFSLSELESLIPSAELDDHRLASDTRGTWENSNRNPSLSPPHHTELLAEDFSPGLNQEDNSRPFNLLTQDLLDVEGRSSSQYPENLQSFDNFHPRDMRPSSFSSEQEGDDMTQDLRTSPSSSFLFDEGVNVEDEDGLLPPLRELLEDASILEEIRLLDLELGGGFSPEMAARLEEEGYLNSEMAKQDTRRSEGQSGSNTEVMRNQDQPGTHQEDNVEEADSDSGLSLDFSHSPASPSASEASSYSSSSSSSSSCTSAAGSPLSEDEDAEEGSVGSEMEVEVIIKQEELDEEEMGAVGGSYPPDVKDFSLNYGDHKMFTGFPWMEHVGHDHTYNQPWSSPSTQSAGKMPTKHPKSFSRHDRAKPYRSSSSRHISDSKMRSRDERRARALKVPFSNDLIVNLPVEEFNDLLAKYQLNEDQLALVRDIRRRGKNKIAAQNCRKRKLDVLYDLKDNVSGLRRYRSRLVREKQEALRSLQEMKRQLGVLYEEVFSRLRDEEGRPLDAMEYLLEFEPDGGVTVASRQQGAARPLTKTSKKQRDKKK
ncbi:endoplasmic reticulum membrane sensor NFE2L1-like [Notolabrus celidotus]|uniref:endoplasmic reticulum membrane sensor NFE2L1-like n=1 Tax=Notolabrus celidotus TaxID=1203425 RepID=UPI00148FD835|nr:endoplasmic reticulum membrane sensor NFE2L1-like [Notolabrus celidotus]